VVETETPVTPLEGSPGGGGGGGGGHVAPSGAGGSGIVIIRCLTSDLEDPPPVVTLETPNNFTNFTTTNEVDLNVCLLIM